MAGKTAATPWQDLERQAYHAYREWQLWLVLRQRLLAQRLPAHPPAIAHARASLSDAGSRQPLDRGDG